MSYSGRFDGNGYSIKGLNMNTQIRGYDGAGLFCNLKNAIVENFVIDSSCSFNGISAGALSVSIDGSLTVRNIINKAFVNGTDRLGGFIGYIESLEQGSVLIQGCMNEGNVTGTSHSVGGFVGRIYNNRDISVRISNSINSGNVTAGWSSLGGFVGGINANEIIVMTITNSRNNGYVAGSDYIGGFVGTVSNNDNMNMTISSSTNNERVSSKGVGRTGGFVGNIWFNTGTIIITNCTNKGILNGDINSVGGLAGVVSCN